MKKLTIGSAVYDDFEGVYFSYQSLRLNNPELKNDIEYIIIDNNPSSAEGKAVKEFCQSTGHIKYIPYTERRSTSIRNEIFKNSNSEFTLCIDPHVLFEHDTIKKLITYFKKNKDSKDLYHGPMLYDVIDGHDPVSHMDPIWRDNMFGIWSCDKRARDPKSKPFEIPMHGLGIFACKTDAWLGFNENFVGFGGEEGYIHKKFKKENRKIWCLPFLRWIHRFKRPLGTKYPLIIEERVRNYLIGHRELGLPYDEIISHFNDMGHKINFKKLIDELDTTPSLPENKKSKSPIPENLKSWDRSEVSFAEPHSFRYLKYEINDSHDGLASLRDVEITSIKKGSISIHSFSSETQDFPVGNLLIKDEVWLTAKKNPNFFILELRGFEGVKKITTYAPLGISKGLPTKFKIYISNDLIQWKEISDVDIFKD